MQKNNPSGQPRRTVHPLDTVIERRNTDSIKYGAGLPAGAKDHLVSLWVADMDFKVPNPVLEALHRRIDHGIFGYGAADDSYYEAVCSWFDINFGFRPDPRWIVRTPGVVFALSAAICTFTEKEDAIIINRPVYYPFSNLVNELGRKLINSPLVSDGSRYEIDFEDFEKKIVENDVRMYILCSPHNPVGRVWTKEELKKLADICLRHNVLVVADEIHCDFVWPEHSHTMFPSLGEEYRNNCILCTAPSKTFNLAGLNISNIIIPDRDLRHRFKKYINDIGSSHINLLGSVACQAAYESGQPWLDEVRGYIKENIDYVDSFLQENIPEIRLIRPEGTYLLWLDMRELGLSEEELESFITDSAQLWLDGGTMFGPEGAGFQRVNAACPRSILEEAMKRLMRAAKARA